MPRPKGSKNIITKETKELIKGLIDSNYKEFQKRFNRLNDAEYCKVYVNLLKYVVPTLKASETKLNNNKPQTFNVEIIE